MLKSMRSSLRRKGARFTAGLLEEAAAQEQLIDKTKQGSLRAI